LSLWRCAPRFPFPPASPLVRSRAQMYSMLTPPLYRRCRVVTFLNSEGYAFFFGHFFFSVVVVQLPCLEVFQISFVARARRKVLFFYCSLTFSNSGGGSLILFCPLLSFFFTLCSIFYRSFVAFPFTPCFLLAPFPFFVLEQLFLLLRGNHSVSYFHPSPFEFECKKVTRLFPRSFLLCIFLLNIFFVLLCIWHVRFGPPLTLPSG